MKTLTVANRYNADIIDQNYEIWLSNPEALSAEWRAFFEGFELARTTGVDVALVKASQCSDLPADKAIKQANVIGAIYSYRALGHTQAAINPLNPVSIPNRRLSLEYLGLSESDLNDKYYTGNYLNGATMTVAELIEGLKKTYCGTLGVEYTYIQDTPKRRWLQAKMEPIFNNPNFSKERKRRVLQKIAEAEVFENFLHTRFVGQKRFSVEGGESAMAFLDIILEKCPSLGLKKTIMGMAHRGRLNVLVNTVGKDPKDLLRKFSDNYLPESTFGDGDVKYHLGYEGTHTTVNGEKVIVNLAANPSHLEAVNPVVEGKVRANQKHFQDTERRKAVMPILIHGDAAFAGQGVVAETLNLARLEGYTTGGTIHLVINNQIGFTTNPEQARSSKYCTDIAKMLEIPIFHVNGDDPLAVAWAAELAVEYRQEFGDDVVVDMVCYRKHGHNESDEPAFTQPTLYRKIGQHPKVSKVLGKKLIEEGVITQQEIDALEKAYEEKLVADHNEVKKEEEHRNKDPKYADRAAYLGSTAIFQGAYSFEPVETSISLEQLTQISKAITGVPENFKINPKIDRQLKAKAAAFEAGEGIDWATAEALAFGGLILDGHSVRLSGQDSERGTFSHRHCVFYDVETRERYVPLSNVNPKQARFSVYNSSLSEAAVLGFDYGYSLDCPDMLVLWEAQFGDFANGAQIIIDQFIASSESKWQRTSSLTLLLPHGYEGQGPEHSSARLERFLQLCAQDNIQVCNITTPAQYFHLLRRQLKRSFLKPLVIMSPKSLLRHKECISKQAEFISGTFEEILDDMQGSDAPERLILCSGKVYFDLLHYRRQNPNLKANIIRVEQLYPLNSKKLRNIVEKYTGFRKIVWCQEEPRNMGAWSFISPLIEGATDGLRPIYAGRDAAASPAVGALARHRIEQEKLIQDAFTL